ncbi:CBS domain-containing protein [Defluviimonas sp. WL0024]|uniref:CBS domain-containing protein n=2 Tax=Albidovulum TaxID=205889 RepID=A0ABT3J2K6_9RHOB|nr:MULTISPECIES: CBS domain-containing protein [Defluviimonas]MCU9847660.1 CBS domain-containing protein [Defluviimonas sp. WL0024]MCW3781912.1 CBS domain-containing protein [Defluviimonas salinarum]
MAWVRDILSAKRHGIFGVGPDDMVLDALKLMAEKDIGAVLVTEGDRLAGIFTERRYAREVFLKGRSSPMTKVGEVMERDVITVTPDETAEACMALMSRNRIRHLPVMRDGTLVGVISIGDLMQSIIEDREFDIGQLVNYVSR